MSSETAAADPYKEGYRAAQDQAREDLANSLRMHAIAMGEDGEEVLSSEMMRAIFSDVFGVMASDEEFGPDPETA